MKCRPGILDLIVTIGLNPDRTTMRFQDAACDRQPESRSAALELCLATGMQVYTPELAELLKDCFLVFGRDPNSCIRNCYFDEPCQFSSINGDLAAIRCVFDSVMNHIAQCLRNAGRVDVNPILAAFEISDGNRELACLKSRLHLK